MKKIVVVTLMLIFLSSVTVLATTWFNQETKCPMCKAENEFKGIGSYGSYIYNWPSKYQYIYWPKTDSNVLYSCKKCKLTCYMWDFKDIPEDKFDEIKKALKDVEFKGKHSDYSDISMVERLKVALKVYKITKPDDSNFWCEFYRVAGYHVDAAGNTSSAKKLRKKSIEFVEKLLKDEKNKDIKKEHLYIKGAMYYFTDKLNESLKAFEEALKEKYKNPENDDEQNEGFNEYLDKLMKDYVEKIKYVQDVQSLIEKVFEQKWFVDKVNDIKLEKKEKFTVILPKIVLKNIVSGSQPFSFKINDKSTTVIIASAEIEIKNKIEITDFKINDGNASISVKINDSNAKEWFFEKDDDTWKLSEKEK